MKKKLKNYFQALFFDEEWPGKKPNWFIYILQALGFIIFVCIFIGGIALILVYLFSGLLNIKI